MGGLADQGDVRRLRFDVLTKTKQPELHRYWDPARSGGQRAAVPAGLRGVARSRGCSRPW